MPEIGLTPNFQIPTQPQGPVGNQRAIKSLTSTEVRTISGNERDSGVNPTESNIDPVTLESSNPVENQVAERTRSLDEAKRQNLLTKTHSEANSGAKSLLLALVINSDPTLLKKYLEKGSDPERPETLSEAREENISKLLKNPEAINNLASQMAVRLKEGKYQDEKKNEVELSEEQAALYEEVLGTLKGHDSIEGHGSHKKMVDLIRNREGRNGFSFPPEILTQYNSNLETIADINEATKKPKTQSQTSIISHKVDSKEREYFYTRLFKGATTLDLLGGIFNFTDSDVSWNLNPYMRGANLPVRILAHTGNSKGNSGPDRGRTLGDFLTMNQPMPYTNTVA